MAGQFTPNEDFTGETGSEAVAGELQVNVDANLQPLAEGLEAANEALQDFAAGVQDAFSNASQAASRLNLPTDKINAATEATQKLTEAQNAQNAAVQKGAEVGDAQRRVLQELEEEYRAEQKAIRDAERARQQTQQQQQQTVQQRQEERRRAATGPTRGTAGRIDAPQGTRQFMEQVVTALAHDVATRAGNIAASERAIAAGTRSKIAERNLPTAREQLSTLEEKERLAREALAAGVYRAPLIPRFVSAKSYVGLEREQAQVQAAAAAPVDALQQHFKTSQDNLQALAERMRTGTTRLQGGEQLTRSQEGAVAASRALLQQALPMVKQFEQLPKETAAAVDAVVTTLQPAFEQWRAADRALKAAAASSAQQIEQQAETVQQAAAQAQQIDQQAQTVQQATTAAATTAETGAGAGAGGGGGRRRRRPTTAAEPPQEPGAEQVPEAAAAPAPTQTPAEAFGAVMARIREQEAEIAELKRLIEARRGIERDTPYVESHQDVMRALAEGERQGVYSHVGPSRKIAEYETRIRALETRITELTARAEAIVNESGLTREQLGLTEGARPTGAPQPSRQEVALTRRGREDVATLQRMVEDGVEGAVAALAQAVRTPMSEAVQQATRARPARSPEYLAVQAGMKRIDDVVLSIRQGLLQTAAELQQRATRLTTPGTMAQEARRAEPPPADTPERLAWLKRLDYEPPAAKEARTGELTIGEVTAAARRQLEAITQLERQIGERKDAVAQQALNSLAETRALLEQVLSGQDDWLQARGDLARRIVEARNAGDTRRVEELRARAAEMAPGVRGRRQAQSGGRTAAVEPGPQLTAGAYARYQAERSTRVAAMRQELVRQGLTPAGARQQAARQMGDVIFRDRPIGVSAQPKNWDVERGQILQILSGQYKGLTGRFQGVTADSGRQLFAELISQAGKQVSVYVGKKASGTEFRRLFQTMPEGDDPQKYRYQVAQLSELRIAELEAEWNRAKAQMLQLRADRRALEHEVATRTGKELDAAKSELQTVNQVMLQVSGRLSYLADELPPQAPEERLREPEASRTIAAMGAVRSPTRRAAMAAVSARLAGAAAAPEEEDIYPEPTIGPPPAAIPAAAAAPTGPYVSPLAAAAMRPAYTPAAAAAPGPSTPEEVADYLEGLTDRERETADATDDAAASARDSAEAIDTEAEAIRAKLPLLERLMRAEAEAAGATDRGTAAARRSGETTARLSRDTRGMRAVARAAGVPERFLTTPLLAEYESGTMSPEELGELSVAAREARRQARRRGGRAGELLSGTRLASFPPFIRAYASEVEPPSAEELAALARRSEEEREREARRIRAETDRRAREERARVRTTPEEVAELLPVSRRAEARARTDELPPILAGTIQPVGRGLERRFVQINEATYPLYRALVDYSAELQEATRGTRRTTRATRQVLETSEQVISLLETPALQARARAAVGTAVPAGMEGRIVPIGGQRIRITPETYGPARVFGEQIQSTQDYSRSLRGLETSSERAGHGLGIVGRGVQAINRLFRGTSGDVVRFGTDLIGLGVGISILGSLGRQLHDLFAAAIQTEGDWQRAARATNAVYGERSDQIEGVNQQLARSAQIAGTRTELVRAQIGQQAFVSQIQRGLPADIGAQLGATTAGQALARRAGVAPQGDLATQLNLQAGLLGREFGTSVEDAGQAIQQAISGSTDQLTRMTGGAIDVSSAALTQRLTGRQPLPGQTLQQFGAWFDQLPEATQQLIRLQAIQEQLNDTYERQVGDAQKLADSQDQLAKSNQQAWEAFSTVVGYAGGELAKMLAGLTGLVGLRSEDILRNFRTRSLIEAANPELQATVTGTRPEDVRIYRRGPQGYLLQLGAEESNPIAARALAQAQIEQGVKPEDMAPAVRDAAIALQQEKQAADEATRAHKTQLTPALAGAANSLTALSTASQDVQSRLDLITNLQPIAQRAQQLGQAALGPFAPLVIPPGGITSFAQGQAISQVLAQRNAATALQAQNLEVLPPLVRAAAQGPGAVATIQGQPGTRPAAEELADLQRQAGAQAQLKQIEQARAYIAMGRAQAQAQLDELSAQHQHDLLDVQANGISRQQELTNLKAQQLQLELAISDNQLQQTQLQARVTIAQRTNLETERQLLLARQGSLAATREQEDLQYRATIAGARLRAIGANVLLGRGADFGAIPGLVQEQIQATLEAQAQLPQSLEAQRSLVGPQRQLEDEQIAQQQIAASLQNQQLHIQTALDLRDLQREPEREIAERQVLGADALERQATAAERAAILENAGLAAETDLLNVANDLLKTTALQLVADQARLDIQKQITDEQTKQANQRALEDQRRGERGEYPDQRPGGGAGGGGQPSQPPPAAAPPSAQEVTNAALRHLGLAPEFVHNDLGAIESGLLDLPTAFARAQQEGVRQGILVPGRDPYQTQPTPEELSEFAQIVAALRSLEAQPQPQPAPPPAQAPVATKQQLQAAMQGFGDTLTPEIRQIFSGASDQVLRQLFPQGPDVRPIQSYVQAPITPAAEPEQAEVYHAAMMPSTAPSISVDLSGATINSQEDIERIARAAADQAGDQTYEQVRNQLVYVFRTAQGNVNGTMSGVAQR
jgi:hypothetical protein